MTIIRLAAFSDGTVGGNPAGVHISPQHPSEAEMQSIASDVGFSETAFVQPHEHSDATGQAWRARYFSPETEVPFCGHATIALGAALAKQQGAGIYKLALNETTISVEGFAHAGHYSAALQSPDTRSELLDSQLLTAVLELFGYNSDALDPRIPPAFANAGANHLIVALNSRESLSAMSYDLDQGRHFMRDAGIVTVMFVFAESDQLFHSRNPFASGGVYEDPATGAASAAFAGYLRDINWPHAGAINLIQGEDMGSRSLIHAEFSTEAGSSIRVSGSVRELQ